MIGHLRSRRAHRSRGQALVEFALVAPFFFMLLLAIVEFGLAVYYIQVLNNAAREGARYARPRGALRRVPGRVAEAGEHERRR